MPAKLNRSEKLYEGRVFRLIRENITLENGVTVDMDLVRHPGAAAIVPLSEDHSVVLIRQYRHAVGRFIWEIPAGTLNPHEKPLECARRELAEEAGYTAGEWRKLGEITPVPGYSDERIHIFMATRLVPSVQNLDRDEVLDVHEMEFEEAMEMIHKGQIQDAKTLSGLFLAGYWLENRMRSAKTGSPG